MKEGIKVSESQFLIKTIMGKEDYKKFLYIATFRRNKFIVPLVTLMALAGSLIVNWSDVYFNIIAFILTWILLLVLAIGVVCFKVERKNRQRLATDKTGVFGSVNVLKFCDDKVIMENEALNSVSELRYDQFYKLMESKDYFIFYITINQVSLLRKKDVENINNFKNFIVPKFENRYRKI